MHKLIYFVLALLLTLGLSLQTAEAKRFGGGRSFGQQRHASSWTAPAKATPAPIVQNSKGRGLLGLLGGLAVGGLLASLFMGHGFGNGLLMILLLIGGGIVLISLFRRRGQTNMDTTRQNSAQPYANTYNAAPSPINQNAAFTTNATSANALNYPAGFDTTEFLYQAKALFIRLQAAYDKADLHDIRTFTTPETFAEISVQVQERGTATNYTEVVTLNAEITEFVSSTVPLVVSVLFSGLIREDVQGNPEAFNEAWILQQSDATHWLVTGIQQR